MLKLSIPFVDVIAVITVIEIGVTRVNTMVMVGIAFVKGVVASIKTSVIVIMGDGKANGKGWE